MIVRRGPVVPLAGVLVVLAAFGVGCSSSSGPLPAAAPTNPLPPCSDSPNCERMSQDYSVPPDTLYARAERALRALGPSRLRTQPDSMQASAVYRVAWVFKDDMVVDVEGRSAGSRLHVRSASRVGHSDLGVNRRRVQRFLRAVEASPN